MNGLYSLEPLRVVFREFFRSISTQKWEPYPDKIRAGLFWASEGAVALGYPEPAKRGQYMK